ncbi:hypothetical protein HDU85_002987 [Gaertneriomyces sp. JEL0708]|nr:hypothetical protein HDU85_002987 [Gaertneriomyces sp. JEL0708]
MEDIASAGLWTSLSPALSPPILGTLESLSFQQMTPVQAATVPLFMRNKDVVVEAATGSGKTIAFVIPIVEMLIRRHQDNRGLLKNHIGAVIVSPTRELAKQISEVVNEFVKCVNDAARAEAEAVETNGVELDADAPISRYPCLTTALYIGGSPLQSDIKTFMQTGAHIIIGTPGRLSDLLDRSTIFNTRELEVLVLDEADRLLDMGFEQTLTAIMKKLPKQRRTGLFSATMSDAVGQLVRVGLRNPVKVQVKVQNKTKDKAGDMKLEDQVTPKSLEIGYVLCGYREKMKQLIGFLTKNTEQKYLVYFATCACVDYFFKTLSSLPELKPFTLHSLHGRMDPKRRTIVYQKFSSTPSSILLCTDIAARGLDIPDIDVVIQYDPPQDPKAFAHRCGRTARLGRVGHAIVLLGEGEEVYVDFLRVRKVPMSEIPKLEPAADVDYFAKMRTLNAKDRDIYEKSLKAFVSFVRSYAEHQASYIFQLKNLPLPEVATSFGLLHLPKMPELKNIKIAYPAVQMEYSTIPYKDKAREKQRREKMKKDAEEREKAKEKDLKRRKKPVAWSDKKEAKEKRLERKEKRGRKKIAVAKSKAEGTFVPKIKGAEQVGKRSRDSDSDSDSSDSDGGEWKAMQQEKRASKKMKQQGKSVVETERMEELEDSDSA